MMNKIRIKIMQSLRVIYHELYCLICCFAGSIKVKLFFSKGRHNKLEIGAGQSEKKGMLTTDLNLKSDFPFDLRAGLPFPDDSIDVIYAEHVLEHFQYKDVMMLLGECKRVMKLDAVFKVSVPNAHIYLDAYVNPDEFDRKSFCVVDTGLSFDSRIDYVNYMFYMDGHHRHMFDGESLLTTLETAGFSKVSSREFDAELDRLERKHESIYAQCVKE